MAFHFEKPPGFDFKPGQSVIAGPPAMVSGMRKMLVASGVDEDDIRTDEFAGY
jgi:NAD(P)H-flavin reductase